MIDKTIKSLIDDDKYDIVGYFVDNTSVILYVDSYTDEQSKIPSIIDGRDVRISISL